MLRKAASHRGSAFVEIFQNCNIYNDGAFDAVRDDESNRIYLRDGEPIRFGADGERGVVLRADGSAEVRAGGRGRRGGAAGARRAPPRAVSLAFALSRLTLGTVGATPVGVFRDVDRPSYDELMADQLERAKQQRGEGDLHDAAPRRRHLGRRVAPRTGLSREAAARGRRSDEEADPRTCIFSAEAGLPGRSLICAGRASSQRGGARGKPGFPREASGGAAKRYQALSSTMSTETIASGRR